ncbi:MAG: class I SAM-dependent methyltransferase [Candidatus Hydrogenedentes bacterium]|nr:class I SAM-dependent methyltransferase [Candidatus Hydrogenedentota bacterium]
MSLHNANLSRAIQILNQGDIEVPDNFYAGLKRYLAVLQEWNPRHHLVSAADLKHLIDRHVVDSLSLLPIIGSFYGAGGAHLDIGSGSGFPVMVLALASPGIDFVALERSEVKYGFLEKIKATCGLKNVSVFCGHFPELPDRGDFTSFSARAVEKPRQIEGAVAKFMRPGSVFLCQSGDPLGFDSELFHVERVDDLWKTEGLRRGELFVVQKTHPHGSVPRGTVGEPKPRR